MIREAVEAHYVQQWGKPSRRAEFRRPWCNVEVFKWDARTTGEGVAIYATVGASEFPMKGAPSDHRFEYFVGLNPERDEIASPLAGLGLYAFEEGVSVGHGHTVPAGKPLWPGSGMSTFLVLQPVTKIVPSLRLSSGIHVDFLQAIPIYASEVKFKAEHQAEGLLERWQRAHVRFWNPERSAEPAAAR